MASAKKLWLATTRLSFIVAAGNVLDAAGEKLGVVFQAEDDATITHLGLWLSSLISTPVYKIGLQGVGATGDPDGTYLGGGSPASATFDPSALGWSANTPRWVALDNSIAITRGTFYAWVIEYSSGTIGGSNNAGFAADSGDSTYIPYWLLHNGASWAKQTAWSPMWGYRSTSNRWGKLGNSTSAAVPISSDGNRAATKFTLPAGHGDTFKIKGFAANVNTFSGGGSITVGLWNAAGTALQSFSWDTDFIANSGSNFQKLIFPGTLATLSYGTPYYIGFERNGSSFWHQYAQLGEADDLLMYPGEGDFGFSTWNGSVWTDDVDVIPHTQLYFDDITEPAGGGGGADSDFIGQGVSLA